jgi:hypothetical protein
MHLPVLAQEEDADFLEELEARYMSDAGSVDDSDYKLELGESSDSIKQRVVEADNDLLVDEAMSQSERAKLDEDIKRIEEQQALRQKERDEAEAQKKESQLQQM